MALFRNFGRVSIVSIGGDIRSFSKGYILRRCIPLWLLLTLLFFIPNSAQSQTRFFERGDSGFIPSFDWIATQGYNNIFDVGWGANATYTYKGLFDVGAGFKAESLNVETFVGPQFLFANVVVIEPKGTRGLGLELKGRYTNQSWDLNFHFEPIYASRRNRSYITGLRGFYRNAPANLIVGLGGIYTFNKNQTLDHSDEVLFGHDYGEVGFTLDGHFLAGRLIHFSLQAKYAQNNQLSFHKDWRLSVVLSAGFLIGLNPEPGGEIREP